MTWCFHKIEWCMFWRKYRRCLNKGIIWAKVFWYQGIEGSYGKCEEKRGCQFAELYYTVIREVELSDHEFQKFCSDFLEEQPWIEKGDGGSNAVGELRCIRVKNVETGDRVLVNSEGYESPRYTAIEE